VVVPVGGMGGREGAGPRRGGAADSLSDRSRKAALIGVRVEFVTGRGGEGFHWPGPALTTGRGGYFVGDPRRGPVRGESPLIPWMGPRFSPPVLMGTRLGNGRARGQGQGTVK